MVHLCALLDCLQRSVRRVGREARVFVRLQPPWEGPATGESGADGDHCCFCDDYLVASNARCCSDCDLEVCDNCLVSMCGGESLCMHCIHDVHVRGTRLNHDCLLAQCPPLESLRSRHWEVFTHNRARSSSNEQPSRAWLFFPGETRGIGDQDTSDCAFGIN